MTISPKLRNVLSVGLIADHITQNGLSLYGHAFSISKKFGVFIVAFVWIQHGSKLSLSIISILESSICLLSDLEVHTFGNPKSFNSFTIFRSKSLPRALFRLRFLFFFSFTSRFFSPFSFFATVYIIFFSFIN